MKTKPTFRYVTYINTTPQELWKALTTTDLIRLYWSGRSNTSRWKSGAALESRSPKGELEWKGKILESKRPKRLVYTFDCLNSEPASRVTFEIERLSTNTSPQGVAVRLVVTHDRFPIGSKNYEGVKEGWPTILSSLKSLLETGKALTFTWKEHGD